MLIHQVIQDMLQESNLVKMETTVMLAKEILRMRKIKQKLSQLSQHAMELMEQRELIASIESHFLSAQEILSQRSKKVLQQTVE